MPAGFATGAITEGAPDNIVKAEDVKKDEVKEFGGKGVKDSTLKETENGSSVLKMEYAGTAKNPTLKITNSGENAYEFVKESKGAEKPGDSAKAVKAAKGKTITVKGIKDEEVIFVRVAGDKTKQDWVGVYAKLGVIDVPKTVTGTKTDGATPTPTPGVTDQQLLQSLADELVADDTTTAEVSTKDQSIAIGSDKIKWDEAKDYTLEDGSTVVSGVTVGVAISANIVNDDGNNCFVVKTQSEITSLIEEGTIEGTDVKSPVFTALAKTKLKEGTLKVKITLSKANCTNIEKDVNVTVTKQ